MALAILTYGTLQQIKRQADAAQGQVSIMQRQIEVSERPWLSVKTNIAGPFICDLPDEGCYMRLALTFENVGHAPAVDISYQLTFLPDRYPNHYRLFEDQRSICERIRELEPTVSSSEDEPIPRTIFPGEQKMANQEISMDPKELTASIKVLGEAIRPVLFTTPSNAGVRHFAIEPTANKEIPATELFFEERQTEAN